MPQPKKSGLVGPQRIWLAAGLLALTLTIAVISGCAKQSSEATASLRDITAYVTATGVVYAPATARADVFSPYQAPVEKIYVAVGSSVRRGETLLLFSAPQTQAYYDQARAALVQARNSLAQAQSQFGQELKAAQQQLAASRSVERKARDAAQSPSIPPEGGASIAPDVVGPSLNRQADEQAVIDAQARMAEGLVPYQQALVAAQEQFAAAQAGGKSAQLKSPITGTVLAVNISPGAVADPEKKEPLITVVNLEALKVTAGIEEEQLNMLKPDYPAVVTIKEVPNVEFAGKLDEIYSENAGFLRGQKYTALVDFRNTKGQAKPGMEAGVSIKVGHVSGVIAVPANAIKKVDQQYAVMVREGGEWPQRIVEVGLSDGQYTQIKSGVKEGDVVMTNP